MNKCNNCGKSWHIYKQCRLPITSNGIININEKKQYLMICRKKTLGYVDFVRGKYNTSSSLFLMNLMDEMTIHEKKDLVEFFKTNKEYFKNAGGDCETFISKIKMVHSKRVFTLDKSFKFKININDVTEALNIIKKYKMNTEKIFLDYYT